ncbi:hypothetical protein L2E82_14597 [Cichorium intybus]|uniref:Uncharacterized protein n=1 Tax=Cichorium intybus TaxID=13427 RepID=A0ACB9F0V5_CICIN|nr:hypothetical protein L2E82_14597 [Cichorium intybus]
MKRAGRRFIRDKGRGTGLGIFGFVRFIRVTEVEKVVLKINSIVINGSLLRANVARFSRNGTGNDSSRDFKNKAFVNVREERKEIVEYNKERRNGKIDVIEEGEVGKAGKWYRSFRDVVSRGNIDENKKVRTVKDSSW